MKQKWINDGEVKAMLFTSEMREQNLHKLIYQKNEKKVDSAEFKIENFPQNIWT